MSNENVRLLIQEQEDGTVEFSILRASTMDPIYVLTLEGEHARKTAETLTIASWRAEELKKRASGND
ncbi:hypothetical protein ACFY7C_19480 [Streptomyces sp. NPDC012769]|uniref:hypothetical protein n=1 Tax=Streptomyces sp. NPDC012769 TaxID=3364848 RepID=UPI0036CD8D98